MSRPGPIRWRCKAGLAPARVLGANDRVRFGIIGAGARGMEIFQAAIKCPNVEAVAAADIYDRQSASGPGVLPVFPSATPRSRPPD